MKSRIALNIRWFLATWGVCLLALVVYWLALSLLVPTGAGRRSGFVLVAGRTVIVQSAFAFFVTATTLIASMVFWEKLANAKTYFWLSMVLGLVGGALVSAFCWQIVLYEALVFGLVMLAAFVSTSILAYGFFLSWNNLKKFG
jgi:hypothetical protein